MRKVVKYANKSKGTFNIGAENGAKFASRLTGSVTLVCLACILIFCNFLLLYSAENRRGLCKYEDESWNAYSNVSSTKLDYQRVRGSGSSTLSLPLPIPNDTVLFGSDSSDEDGERIRFMTIGIPSVGRKYNYLYLTLDSILNATSEEEKLDCFVFLLIADADPQTRLTRASNVYERYQEYVDNGFLRILQPPTALYPSINFSNIRRTHKDSIARVQWRAKQVLDFAFLFWYSWSRKPSKYFMILEDDLVSAKHFVSATKDFVNLYSKHYWIALKLTGFLGIGQLVRCSDLDRLVNFLLNFYLEHPVDILFNHWVRVMAPDKLPKYLPERRIPGLFQHIGVHSTLANKTQKLQDNTFSLVKRQFSHINPIADIVTNIRQYKSFVAEFAYSPAPGMFWGIPEFGNTFDIVFSQPLQLSRLVILTGTIIYDKKSTLYSKKNGEIRDKIKHGHVEISSAFEKMSPNKVICSNFTFLQRFKDGVVDHKGFSEYFPEGVQCVRVVIDKGQKNWIAISEIAVFTVDETDEMEVVKHK